MEREQTEFALPKCCSRPICALPFLREFLIFKHFPTNGMDAPHMIRYYDFSNYIFSTFPQLIEINCSLSISLSLYFSLSQFLFFMRQFINIVPCKRRLFFIFILSILLDSHLMNDLAVNIHKILNQFHNCLRNPKKYSH